MGLFSFLKGAGKKLFNRKDKEAEEARAKAEAEAKAANDLANIERRQRIILMKGVIRNLGLNANNIDIDMAGDVVILTGSVPTTADKEKLVLTLGNLDEIAFVDDRLTVTNPEPPAKFVTVEKGDSLSKISKRYYGDPMKYPIIFEANKPMIKDPNEIFPGQVLRIPAVEGTYAASMNTYEVQQGDTLGKIAKELYGDASKYQLIFRANQPMLSDPDAIRVGQILTIPPESGVA